MNELNRLTYLEDISIDQDPLWQQSYETFRKALEGNTIETAGSVIPIADELPDYSVCWNAEHVFSKMLWIPGYRTTDGIETKLSGKRPLRTVAYMLCHPGVQIRGSKIVQCCADPYCVNPAHTYLVSNKYKLYDQVYIGVTDEEWEAIRGEILHLEKLRNNDRDIMDVLAESYTGAPQRKISFLEEQKKRNYMHADLTNDQILSMAIRRHAKAVYTSTEFCSLDSFLSQYQLKTEYARTKLAFKEMVQSITEKCTRCNAWDGHEMIKQTLLFCSIAFDELEMQEAMKLITTDK